jgi:hypothetical protein
MDPFSLFINFWLSVWVGPMIFWAEMMGLDAECFVPPARDRSQLRLVRDDEDEAA